MATQLIDATAGVRRRQPLRALPYTRYNRFATASPCHRTQVPQAQDYASWGIPHVWIIDPDTKECFEYHGGNQFLFVRDTLTAGPLSVRLADIFAGLESPKTEPEASAT